MTLGLGWTVQLAPSQFSTYGVGVSFWPLAEFVAPVAQHWVLVRHVTDVRMFAGVVGLRDGVGVHVDPFQYSTTEEDGLPFESRDDPTAQQLVLWVHVTPVRYCPGADAFVATDQELPSQCSMSALAPRAVGAIVGKKLN